jgi:hypothetical protein
MLCSRPAISSLSKLIAGKARRAAKPFCLSEIGCQLPTRRRKSLPFQITNTRYSVSARIGVSTNCCQRHSVPQLLSPVAAPAGGVGVVAGSEARPGCAAVLSRVPPLPPLLYHPTKATTARAHRSAHRQERPQERPRGGHVNTTGPALLRVCRKKRDHDSRPRMIRREGKSHCRGPGKSLPDAPPRRGGEEHICLCASG